ncbi:hypothetical protein [Bordetella hinzii]|jgi:hypothetical protein|uniref:hypothetical protein n=1 Tax=Bordetella hinzii TaxID=103855 RepID=UPI00045AA41A|nr:hypothetical protein [Bordetella hinzii]KCB48009.1 hypothetical protein L538_1707 [Bordetella hinzii 4161]KXA73479.1 hypothetical protein AXA74_07210 [Bordetella hinzii LMG 13501]QDJ39306.1 hypothetical protein CBR67_22930 [Bordetella hinzii]VEH23545.1 Uncharacterised protein [Bordetella hinzii]
MINQNNTARAAIRPVLTDARRVQAVQDLNVSNLAQRWRHMPAWRAAMKTAAQEAAPISNRGEKNA